MSRLICSGLVLKRGKTRILDGVRFELVPSTLALMVGAPGAGKTMLARALAGLERFDEGSITLGGRDLKDTRPAERRIGVVFAEGGLWPHRTVAENVGYPLKVQGVGRAERRRRVAEVLSATRLDSLADAMPGDLEPLSARRAALARALVSEPQLLIWDEPFAGLESRDRQALADHIRLLRDETQTTTLALTSEPAEALALAEYVLILDMGRILQAGPPQDVYLRPTDPLVAQLLGPTNLFQGHVEGTDTRGDLIVRTPWGRLAGQSPVGLLPAGLAVTVAIRPEAVLLSGVPAPLGANRVAATLDRQVFLGALRRLHLRGPGDWPIEVLATQSLSNGLREGQPINLSMPTDQVIVLPGKGPGG